MAFINQRLPLPRLAILAHARRAGASSEPGVDVQTFSSPIFRDAHFAVEGHAAGKAAHAIADERGTELASWIDGQLTPAERTIKFCRLRIAYSALQAVGIATD